MRGGFGDQIADTLVQLADVLEGLQPDEWGTQSLCARWSVRDVVGHLVWRVGSTYAAMARTAAPMLALTRPSLDSITDAVSRQEGEASTPDDLVHRLRHIAALRRAGIGRTGMTDLVETVVHSFDIVQPLGTPIEVDPDATRRVALRGLLMASADRRLVVGHHTLWASDAGWALGRGDIIEGSAQGIVLYVYGRSPVSGPAARA